VLLVGSTRLDALLVLLLIVIALFWLVPTLGLFLTSLLPADEIANEGWWKVIADPGISTLQNYSDLFDNEAIVDSLWTTLWITLGGTALPIFVASLAGYAFAWIEFPGRDWLFILVVALLVVRGLPAYVYRRFLSGREAVSAGLLQATSLSFVVAASQIGVELGELDSADAAGLVTGGVLSVLLFPVVALRLLRSA